jgi:hypothetical protein
MLQPTMKKFALSASIFAASTLSFGIISPANAAPCMGFYSISQLTTPGFSCDIGDKEYSGFTGFSGFAPGSGFTFTQNGKSHTFQGTGLNANVGTYTYGFTVALFNPPAGQAFKSFITDASGSDTGSGFTYNKTLASNAPDTGSSMSSNAATGNMSDFTTPYPSGQIAPVTFSATINVLTGTLTGTTDSVNQQLNGTSEVPGPLPLLGAGAAFGFSRRLRSRIKIVA